MVKWNVNVIKVQMYKSRYRQGMAGQWKADGKMGALMFPSYKVVS